MTHDELRDNLEAWAIGALRAPEADEVENHLATCPACSVQARALSFVPVALRVREALEAPSSAVRARLFSAIGGAVALPGTVEVAGRPRTVERRTGIATPVMWFAIAASLVLAAFLGWDGVRLRGRIAELTSELAQARAAIATTENRMASLQRSANQNHSAFGVLTAPDVARIDLAGQPDAPQATGRAWSRARGMVFSATNLPPPPPGRAYQVWVVTSAPAPVSAGLIEPDRTGQVSTVFATPSDIPQPVAVAVTLEPAGGVPAPTGPKVLVGTV